MSQSYFKIKLPHFIKQINIHQKLFKTCILETKEQRKESIKKTCQTNRKQNKARTIFDKMKSKTQRERLHIDQNK